MAIAGLPSLLSAQTVERYDIRGHVRFDLNGAFGNLADQPPFPAAPAANEMAVTVLTAIPNAPGSGATGVARTDAPGLPNPTPQPPPFDLSIPSVEYVLAVGDVAAGTIYTVTASARFDHDGAGNSDDTYEFDPRNTPPLDPSQPDCLPGVNCLLDFDFLDCAGVVVIRYQDPGGNPITFGDPDYPTGGAVTATQLLPLPVGVQATTKIRSARETRFAVQAMPRNLPQSHPPPFDTCTDCQWYRIVVTVNQGTDPFCDTLITQAQFSDVSVRCGQETILTVTIPRQGELCCEPGGQPCGGGGASGDWQVLGFEEDVIYNFASNELLNMPTVFLDHGPLRNRRLARVSEPLPRPYPSLGDYNLQNVPLSTLSDDFDWNYRAWDRHLLNDDADPETLARGPAAGQPCGPNLDDCGRVMLVTTSTAQGIQASDANFTAGELLWDDCFADPFRLPPTAVPDTDFNDWLFIDAQGEPLVRCPNWPTLPPQCAGQLSLRPNGTAPITAADEVKLFVMDPGYLDARLTLRDGATSATHLDLLEHLSVRSGALDLALYTADAIFFESFAEAFGAQRTAPSCNNFTAANDDHRGRVISSYLEDPTPDLGAGFGRREFNFRVAPGQVSSLSGWYEWNLHTLLFDNRTNDPCDHFLGTAWLNRPITGVTGDARRAHFEYGTALSEDIEYCFGKLIVVVNAANSDIALAGNSVSGHSISPVAPGAPAQSFLMQGIGDATDARLVRYHVPVAAGSTYEVSPGVQFVGAGGQTVFGPFTTCAVDCGEVRVACLANEPQVRAATVLGTTTLDGDCDDATADVQLCLYDCNGNPGATVDLLACADVMVDGAVADPACPATHPYLARTEIDVPAGTEIDCPNGCRDHVLQDLPLPDGHGLTVNYVFVLTDDPGSCQLASLTSVSAPLAITAVDDTPPQVTCTSVVTCTDQLSVSLSGPAAPCATVTDNCPGTIDLEWTANNGAAPAAGSATIPPATHCADGTYQLGQTTVTWTATDAAANSSLACSSTVEVHSVPVACIDTLPQTTWCRTGAPILVPLTSACSAQDLNNDGFTIDPTLSWAAAGNCSLSPTTGPTTTVTLNDPGECEPAATCVVTLTSEKFPACNSVVSVNLKTVPRPTVSAGPDVAACRPRGGAGDVTLSATASPCDGSPGVTFSWSPPTCGVLAGGNTATPVLTYSGPDACATCETTVTVTNDSGCDATDTVAVEFRETPLADPGGPYEGCTDLGGGPTSVTLNGSSVPATPCPSCSPTTTYAWRFQGCTGVSPTTASGPSPVVSVDDGACTGDTCEVCLTVTQCVDCVSDEACVPFDYQPEPEADYAVAPFTLGECNKATFVNNSNYANCPEQPSCGWSFGPDPVSIAPPLPGCGDSPVVTFDTCGKKQVALTVLQGECASVDDDPCGVCVPGCTSIAFSGASVVIKCSDNTNPCDWNTHFSATWNVKCLGGPNGCCPSGPTLTGSASATVAPCTAGGVPRTITSTLPLVAVPDALGAGGFNITSTFTSDCIYNLLRAQGCNCGTPGRPTVLSVTVELDLVVACGACTWPVTIRDAVSRSIPLQCIPGAAGHDCLTANNPPYPPGCASPDCVMTPP